jgi:hypothetical protein
MRKVNKDDLHSIKTYQATNFNTTFNVTSSGVECGW